MWRITKRELVLASLAILGALAVGIGCGHMGTCGDIVISGGQIVSKDETLTDNGAIGGNAAAGIGSGVDASSSCGSITIGRGITYIRAQKGGVAYSCIGKGSFLSNCGTVSVATGLADSSYGFGQIAVRIIEPGTGEDD